MKEDTKNILGFWGTATNKMTDVKDGEKEVLCSSKTKHVSKLSPKEEEVGEMGMGGEESKYKRVSKESTVYYSSHSKKEIQENTYVSSL